MKKILITLSTILSVLSAVAQPGSFTESSVRINNQFSKASALENILKRYTTNGLPGAAVAVYSEKEGWWVASAGYANVENKAVLTNAHLHYLQSVSKTYMAVAILKLHEEGRIRLEAPVTSYLPSKYTRYLKSLGKITIRMLLDHTSGLPEYSEHPAFISYVLLHPAEVFDMEKALQFISNDSLLFAPGSKHRYCNTNYLLLSIIADAITGDHAAYIDTVIFKKLGLTHTYYRSSPGYLNYPNLADSYWDVLNTGRPANITTLQRANVATLKGDDGIVCTTTDAVMFLKGLVEGKLLKDTSLALMKQWVNDDGGKPVYGLGLVHYEAGGLTGFGHSGGGIGAGCMLLYVPGKKLYVFMATNVGTLFGGELGKKADDMKNEILASLLF